MGPKYGEITSIYNKFGETPRNKNRQGSNK